MKTVLAYGDSLTWGSVPGKAERHAPQDRWPDVLAATLGDRVQVISDGLRGRSTAYDEHLADCDRNGARILPTVLYAHAPVDLVILMLGSNDLKPGVAGTAIAAMQGTRRCVEIVKNHSSRLAGHMPAEVLIVAPPPMVETADPFYAGMLAGGVEQSAMMASLYADLADEMDCGFFDAGSVATASPIDGIHLDSANTRAIGKALAPMVHVMLGL